MQIERLLEDLTRLPAITAGQVERHYGLKLPDLRRKLRSAIRAGYVHYSVELVRGRDVTRPIGKVAKGGATPSAQAIASEAATRWSTFFEPTVVLRGTSKLCLLYGGVPGSFVTATLSHEIGVSEILLNKRQHDPTFDWTLVQSRPGHGVLPDAISTSGELQIELVGRYNRKMVACKLALSAHATLEVW